MTFGRRSNRRLGKQESAEDRTAARLDDVTYGGTQRLEKRSLILSAKQQSQNPTEIHAV